MHENVSSRQCHSTLNSINARRKFIVKLFIKIPLGTKPQIISASMRTNLQMELCDAWLRAPGISLSEHASSRTSLNHVFSVRQILR